MSQCQQILFNGIRLNYIFKHLHFIDSEQFMHKINHQRELKKKVDGGRKILIIVNLTQFVKLIVLNQNQPNPFH